MILLSHNAEFTRAYCVAFFTPKCSEAECVKRAAQ